MFKVLKFIMILTVTVINHIKKIYNIYIYIYIVLYLMLLVDLEQFYM
jgi:hypothetical protein